MKKNIWIIFFILLGIMQMGMARKGQYDEEARAAEKQAKEEQKQERTNPAKNFVSGIKEATVDSAQGLISETADGARSNTPVSGTLEGAREGSGAVLDHTVKGVAKVATLGYGHVDHYEVEEPEAGSDDTTKIKIKIPGT